MSLLYQELDRRVDEWRARRYELVFAAADTVSDDALDATRRFIGGAE